nr:WYL domain-containing protein [Nesterenkonia xinjiangensis]
MLSNRRSSGAERSASTTGTGQDTVRTFRVDRISTLSATGEPARPAPMDLDEAWRAVVERSEQERSRIVASVSVRETDWPVLRHHFGRHAQHVEDRPEGRMLVQVAAHTVRGLAEQLASWGQHLEVLEPAAVRAELARIGAELLDAYG